MGADGHWGRDSGPYGADVSSSSNEFADRFAQHREREFLSVGLATHHCFGEMNRLLGHDLRREWWLVRIDHLLDDDPPLRFGRPLHDLGTPPRGVNAEPPPTAPLPALS